MRSRLAVRAFPFLVAALLLSACRGDLTYRFDVHPASNTVTVSLKEKFDQQFYALATSQGGSNPFDFDSAKQAGWDVNKSVDDDGNQSIQISKTMPIDSFSDQSSGNGLPDIGGKGLPFDPQSLRVSSGLLLDKATFATTLPAPMPKATDSAANPYASMGSSLAPSVIGVHLEIKMPGKVVETNGETTSDGATRWDINLQRPTEIRYVVQEIDTLHVVLLVITIGVAGVALYRLRKRRAQATLSQELSGEFPA
jgi:hypothetical protein